MSTDRRHGQVGALRREVADHARAAAGGVVFLDEVVHGRAGAAEHERALAEQQRSRSMRRRRQRSSEPGCSAGGIESVHAVDGRAGGVDAAEQEHIAAICDGHGSVARDRKLPPRQHRLHPEHVPYGGNWRLCLRCARGDCGACARRRARARARPAARRHDQDGKDSLGTANAHEPLSVSLRVGGRIRDGRRQPRAGCGGMCRRRLGRLLLTGVGVNSNGPWTPSELRKCANETPDRVTCPSV